MDLAEGAGGVYQHSVTDLEAHALQMASVPVTVGRGAARSGWCAGRAGGRQDDAVQRVLVSPGHTNGTYTGTGEAEGLRSAGEAWRTAMAHRREKAGPSLDENRPSSETPTP